MRYFTSNLFTIRANTSKQEVRPDMIERIDILQTFASLELGNGDILCIQASSQAAE
jgi:hypothetical protein